MKITQKDIAKELGVDRKADGQNAPQLTHGNNQFSFGNNCLTQEDIAKELGGDRKSNQQNVVLITHGDSRRQNVVMTQEDIAGNVRNRKADGQNVRLI